MLRQTSNIRKFLALGLASLLVNACSGVQQPTATSQATLSQQVMALQAWGIKTYQLGDQVIMLLPTAQLFETNSAAFKPASYPTLKKVLVLLNNFPSSSIEVAAHTDKQGAEQRNRALSRARAQALVNFLWKQGLDSRVVYATAHGSCERVASQGEVNNRIEIHLHQVAD